MMIPTVHLNGTSKEALIEQAMGVVRACDALIDALRAASPNGRDYYPQGKEALGQAIHEHQLRYIDVRSIKEEMESIAMAIDEGGHKS